jgi:hypothetical protein
MKNKTNFQDFQINVKLKLSALWASVMFCYIYGDYFALYVPDQLANLMHGDSAMGLTTPLKLVMFSLLMTPPSVMIFLSLALKPTINRVLNIALGLFFTAIMALVVLTSKNPWMLFNTVLGCIEMIITLLIVGYAWKWPKEE